jgi:homoserine O-acetyltransferase
MSGELAIRVTGTGARRVLLLHALTGGPDAADREGVKGWWGPLFRAGAPLDGARNMVWTPNLPGSCYGTAWPGEAPLTVRAQAERVASWILREQLAFEALLGGSLGGMVALELALLLPERFRALGVIGCGGRAHAWLWAQNEVQRAILAASSLGDAEALALARRAAMVGFRAPASLGARFREPEALRAWLAHHGRALAARFTRSSYLKLLDAMDSHDLGRDRGGLASALGGLGAPLHVLGIPSDQLFPPVVVEELAEAARCAGRLGSLAWLASPHGHDAFLLEWDQVGAWLTRILPEAP